MGTTYNISYFGESKNALKNSVDSLLQIVNQSMSTYVKSSTINQFNKNKKTFFTEDPHFITVFSKSKEIFEITDGNFDPTVMPLVNIYGFGPDKSKKVSDSEIAKILRTQVGFDKIKVKNEINLSLTKSYPKVQLDFSAIAKGYGVDKVSELLLQKGIKNHLVEIGGEVVAKGSKPNNNFWKLGIDKPDNSLKNRQLQTIVKLKDKALATSGNYRNFKMQDGKKVVHTINPKTGYPEISNLLSATVLAKDCATADAFATAFMVMGFEKSQNFIKKNVVQNLEVYLIYSENDAIKTWESDDFNE